MEPEDQLAEQVTREIDEYGRMARDLNDAREAFLEWQRERIDNSTFADRMQRILGTESPWKEEA